MQFAADMQVIARFSISIATGTDYTVAIMELLQVQNQQRKAATFSAMLLLE